MKGPRQWTIYVCAGCGRHEADRCDSSCSEAARGQDQRWERVDVVDTRQLLTGAAKLLTESKL